MQAAVMGTVGFDQPRHEKSRRSLEMSTTLYAAGSALALLSGLAPTLLHVGQVAVPNVPGVGDLSDKGIAVAGIVSAVGLGMLALYDNFRSRKRKHDALDAEAFEKSWRHEKRNLAQTIASQKESIAWLDDRKDALEKENQRLQGEIDRIYREREQWMRSRPQEGGPSTG
jgi:hypothetical protein